MHALRYGMVHTCCVCQRIYGQRLTKSLFVISQCSYGNCQATFHPTCARSAGFHMIGGGKLPHKAYCEKHSLEQKAKVLLRISLVIFMMVHLHDKVAYISLGCVGRRNLRNMGKMG